MSVNVNRIQMDKDMLNIITVLVVGITGIYCSYIISPYITKGLNVVSEQVSEQIFNTPLSIPDNQGTIDIVFCFLTTIVLFNCMDIGMFVSSVITNIDLGSVYNAVEPVYENIADDPVYILKQATWENDRALLLQLRPVSSFLESVPLVSLICNCLKFKYAASSIIFLDATIFDAYDELHLEFTESLSLISNTELARMAPFLREYFLCWRLDLQSTDFQYLMQQCNLNSHNQMILYLMEANYRFGSGLGGVSGYELFLRTAVIVEGLNVRPNLFDAQYLWVDGALTLVKTHYINFFMDGSIIRYGYCPALGYEYNLHAIGIWPLNVYDVIHVRKVWKAIAYWVILNS